MLLGVNCPISRENVISDVVSDFAKAMVVIIMMFTSYIILINLMYAVYDAL